MQNNRNRTDKITSTAKSNKRFFVLESHWLCRDFITSSISSKRCSPARKSVVFHSSFQMQCTAIFRKVATFSIDFASRDSNRTHQNAFRSCDSNFVSQTIKIEQIKTSTAKSNARFFVLESRCLSRDFISSSISWKRCPPARKSVVFYSTGAINHMT